MASYFFVISIVILSAFPKTTIGASNEGTMVEMLLKNYSALSRPTSNATTPVRVNLGLRLSKLIKLDLKEHSMLTIVWMKMTWTDLRLTWNPNSHDGAEMLNIPPEKIWTPDIVLFNSAATDADSTHMEKFQTDVIVESNGRCLWMAPLTYKSNCRVDVTYFPFDRQKCSITFGSWTLATNRLLISHNENESRLLSENYAANGDWDLEKIKILTENKKYSCCKTPFSQITFRLYLKHKPLFFLMYLVAPCICISMLILLVFVIPPASGERIGFGITVLLSMSVYLLVVADHLPETSDNAPLLGTFYVLLMFEIAFAFIASVFTLYLHHKKTTPSACLRAICCTNTRVMDNAGKVSSNNTIRDMSTDANRETEELKSEKPWKKISRTLDGWFFWLFIALFVLTSVGIVLIKPKVEIKSLDFL